MANFRKLGTDFSGGVRAAHYTNGRLLTAEDLQQDQQAMLARLAALGKSAGPGIISGFQVTAVSANRSLGVTAGLGINGEGTVIELAATEAVILPVQPVSTEESTIRRAGRFEACLGDNAGGSVPLDSGAYLLTVAPLARLEGAVPRRACDGTETATCANQWEVEGVEFKIIRLINYQAPVGSRANRNRNLLAHWFYGSDKITNLMRDPLRFNPNYSGFSQISAEDFAACDLPLAVFYWTDNGIAFIDQWAVRRRPAHPYPATSWVANLSDRRQAEGQARFLQFQEQIANLQAQFGDETDTIRAVDRFAYLPPVGILPVNPFELIVADVFDQEILDRQGAEIEERGLSQADVLERVRSGVLDSLGTRNAYNLHRFFGQLLSAQYQIVHEDYLHDRLHQSWVQPPILLPPPPATTNFFQFTLADGTVVAVNENNFDNILGNIGNNFAGSIYVPPSLGILASSGEAAAETTTTPASAAMTPGATESLAGNLNLATGYALLSQNYTFRPPWEIFVPPQADDEEVEPLVDIMVMDELLDPYRNQLAQEMVGRIDDAITVLSGTGGTFGGSNRFAAVNNAVANAFTLNTFLWQGANFGTINIANLLQLIGKASPPIFYVLFVRHRPPIQQRPLRL